MKMIVVSISSTEIETCCHLESRDHTSLKKNSLYLYSPQFYQNMSSLKYIFLKSFWTCSRSGLVEVFVLRCSTIMFCKKSFRKTCVRSSSTRVFQLISRNSQDHVFLRNSSGRLLLSTFLKSLDRCSSRRVTRKIFRRIMKLSEKTSQVCLHSALLETLTCKIIKTLISYQIKKNDLKNHLR